MLLGRNTIEKNMGSGGRSLSKSVTLLSYKIRTLKLWLLFLPLICIYCPCCTLFFFRLRMLHKFVNLFRFGSIVYLSTWSNVNWLLSQKCTWVHIPWQKRDRDDQKWLTIMKSMMDCKHVCSKCNQHVIFNQSATKGIAELYRFMM